VHPPRQAAQGRRQRDPRIDRGGRGVRLRGRSALYTRAMPAACVDRSRAGSPWRAVS
jgi:transposase